MGGHTGAWMGRRGRMKGPHTMGGPISCEYVIHTSTPYHVIPDCGPMSRGPVPWTPHHVARRLPLAQFLCCPHRVGPVRRAVQRSSRGDLEARHPGEGCWVRSTVSVPRPPSPVPRPPSPVPRPPPRARSSRASSAISLPAGSRRCRGAREHSSSTTSSAMRSVTT